MSEQDCEQLTLFQADSHASRSPSRGNGSGKQTTVISGRKCSALLKNSGPLGLLAKMLLESSAWQSQLVSLKWKAEQLVAVQEKTTIVRYSHSRKECCSTVSYRISRAPVTRSSHLLFRLVPSKLRTSGNESLLLVGTPTVLDHKRSEAFREGRTPNPGELAMMFPTPTASLGTHGGPNQRDSSGRPGLQMAAMMWPTPTAMMGSMYSETNYKERHSASLATMAAMFPTPKARDYKDSTTLPPSRQIDPGKDSLSQRVGRMMPTPTGSSANGTGKHGDGGPNLQTVAGGQLNPTWVEWLMGFPIGWTDLNASETR